MRNLLLTPRDREILRHLSEVRCLSTAQVAALIASGNKTDQAIVRRLQLLSQAGYVYRLLNHMAVRVDLDTGRYAGKRKMVYALGTAGAMVLGEEGGLAANVARARWDRKNREIKNTQIEHEIMISGVYVALKTGLGPGLVPNMTLHDWHQGRDLYQTFYTDRQGEHVAGPSQEEIEFKGLCRRPVCPDAYFCLDRADTKSAVPCFLEADRDTMSVERFMEKIENYLLWKRARLHVQTFKFEDFLVLTVTPTESRRDSLRKASEKFSRASPGTFRFSVAEEYAKDPKNFVGHIWLLPGTEERRVNLFQ